MLANPFSGREWGWNGGATRRVTGRRTKVVAIEAADAGVTRVPSAKVSEPVLGCVRIRGVALASSSAYSSTNFSGGVLGQDDAWCVNSRGRQEPGTVGVKLGEMEGAQRHPVGHPSTVADVDRALIDIPVADTQAGVDDLPAWKRAGTVSIHCWSGELLECLTATWCIDNATLPLVQPVPASITDGNESWTLDTQGAEVVGVGTKAVLRDRVCRRGATTTPAATAASLTSLQ